MTAGTGQRRWLLGPAFLLVLLPLHGCLGGSKSPTVQYFRIPVWDSVSRSRTPIPVVIQVEEFDVEPAYDHLRLVYRISSVELRHYRYRTWVAKPGRMFGDSLRMYLQASRRFRTVTGQSKPIPDYVLQGKVVALEQVERGKKRQKWFARLALKLQLSRATDGVVVWKKTLDAQQLVKLRKPSAIVATITKLLRRFLDGNLPRLSTAVLDDLRSRGRISKNAKFE